jgi:sensor histidine kinase YesM
MHSFYMHLPLLTAVLFDSHTQFLLSKSTSAGLYLQLFVQLFGECLPFFIIHQLVAHKKVKHTKVLWLIGFVCHPLFLLSIQVQNDDFAHWSLFSTQSWLLITLASMIYFINRAVQATNKTLFTGVISQITSLNGVLILLLGFWALIMAGVFNSHVDPMYNQPLDFVVDVAMVFNHFGRFSYYFWQFLMMAGGIYGLYIVNRYWLIQQVLSKQGVLVFFIAALACIIVITPFMAQLILWLPLNNHDLTLLPSENHLIFDPANYHAVFAVLAITTPLILTFEKQKQDKELIEASEQQIKIELKLLQQQINPHFLFNTLNNLYALTLTKSDDAPQLVMQLANLLRYTVYKGQQEYVTLDHEVAYLQDYIALQKIRSGEKCQLRVSWPEIMDKHKIPPLLLIIILENAFKYGVEQAVEQSYVHFDVSIKGNKLSVTCKNPILKGTLDREASGMGLENLRRRLSLIFPDKHQLHTSSFNGTWCTKLTLDLESC